MTLVVMRVIAAMMENSAQSVEIVWHNATRGNVKIEAHNQMGGAHDHLEGRCHCHHLWHCHQPASSLTYCWQMATRKAGLHRHLPLLQWRETPLARPDHWPSGSSWAPIVMVAKSVAFLTTLGTVTNRNLRPKGRPFVILIWALRWIFVNARYGYRHWVLWQHFLDEGNYIL